MSRITFALFIIIFTATLSTQSSAETIHSRESLLGFAEHLMSEGEYYRAITEYQRVLFHYPEDSTISVRVRIFQAYLQAKQLDTALEEVQKLLLDFPEKPAALAEPLHLAGAELFRTGRYEEARIYLQLILDTWPHHTVATDAKSLLSSTFLALGKPKLALELDSDLNHNINKINIPQRNPRLAGALSAAMPGAGQLYAGRPTDAAVAFTVNLLLIGSLVSAMDSNHNMLAVAIGIFGAGWYGGNVFNAINSARHYNQEAINQASREYYQEIQPSSLQFNLQRSY
ncbi:tetratricopeptide repeat protein [Desulfurispira natronophila]|uniref:Tetratricopeptide (TPR) repeat protein n=1 Tax=Desulfurispira natronophila TaxID=682562 RepID=A0A7W7Y2U5_9BACT|nr:hypothetical protein [Desulfurispira natronophila]MBB5021036.1 tetratricopeptide (TPR) repeat protein [Desulfurispira natronophila]